MLMEGKSMELVEFVDSSLDFLGQLPAHRMQKEAF